MSKIKYILFFFLFVISSEQLFSQFVWKNIGLKNNDLECVTVNDSGHVFVAANVGGLFRSKDNGIYWEKILNQQTHFIYIKSNGFIFAGTENGIYRSIDNGNNWVAVNNGFASVTVYAIAGDSSGHLFTGAHWGNGGIYQSINNGGSWSKLGTTVLLPFCLAINKSGDIFTGALGCCNFTNKFIQIKK